MSNSNVVRTAPAGQLQTSQYIGKSLVALPNSTLNQKLSIQSSLTLAEGEIPTVQYITIGCGGHDWTTSNGKKKWKAVRHTVRHTGMYNQLPFVLRRISNDLTVAERLNYRLRRVETWNDEVYVAYYARVLDLSSTVVNLQLRHVENGVTTSTAYVPTLEDLNPVAPTLVSDEGVTTSGDYVASSAPVLFKMTAAEVAEFQAACAIIFGEDGWGTISEMATVSGVDRVVTGDIGGSTQTWTEVVYAQITAHIATAFVTEFLTEGLQLTVDIGNVEPLLTTTTS